MDEQDPQAMGGPTPEDASQDDAADASAPDRRGSLDANDPSAAGKADASKDDASDELSASASAALATAREAIETANSAGGSAGRTGPESPPRAGADAGGSGAGVSYVPPVLAEDRGDVGGEGIDLLSDVALDVMIELGRTRMLIEDVLRLGDGAVVELDKVAGDPVDIYVNERRVARGEVLVLNDNFCVRISEILDQTIDVARQGAKGKAVG
jgi:flagellar motor switch protein FliN/FliY